MTTKQVKSVLSNGLAIVALKKQIDDLVCVSLTDFINIDKVWINQKTKKLIDSDLEINLSEADFLVIKDFVEANK